jgi:hypothetical protein
MMQHKAVAMGCEGKTDVTLLQHFDDVKYQELAVFSGMPAGEQGETRPAEPPDQQDDTFTPVI